MLCDAVWFLWYFCLIFEQNAANGQHTRLHSRSHKSGGQHLWGDIAVKLKLPGDSIIYLLNMLPEGRCFLRSIWGHESIVHHGGGGRRGVCIHLGSVERMLTLNIPRMLYTD